MSTAPFALFPSSVTTATSVHVPFLSERPEETRKTTGSWCRALLRKTRSAERATCHYVSFVWGTGCWFFGNHALVPQKSQVAADAGHFSAATVRQLSAGRENDGLLWRRRRGNIDVRRLDGLLWRMITIVFLKMVGILWVIAHATKKRMCNLNAHW